MYGYESGSGRKGLTCARLPSSSPFGMAILNPPSALNENGFFFLESFCGLARKIIEST